MNIFKKLAIFCLIAFLTTSCGYSTISDSGYIIMPMKSDTSVKERKEFTYSEFIEENPGPASASANTLFRELIHSPDAESYKVEYEDIVTRNEKLEADNWFFRFSHAGNNVNPCLYLRYFVCRGNKSTSSCENRICSRFNSMKQLNPIKNEFGVQESLS